MPRRGKDGRFRKAPVRSGALRGGAFQPHRRFPEGERQRRIDAAELAFKNSAPIREAAAAREVEAARRNRKMNGWESFLHGAKMGASLGLTAIFNPVKAAGAAVGAVGDTLAGGGFKVRKGRKLGRRKAAKRKTAKHKTRRTKLIFPS